MKIKKLRRKKIAKARKSVISRFDLYPGTKITEKIFTLKDLHWNSSFRIKEILNKKLKNSLKKID